MGLMLESVCDCACSEAVESMQSVTFGQLTQKLMTLGVEKPIPFSVEDAMLNVSVNGGLDESLETWQSGTGFPGHMPLSTMKRFVGLAGVLL